MEMSLERAPERPEAPSGAPPRVIALCGGVGGVKLALGFYHLLAPGELMVVANTGDDFEHLGLAISPDVDTICYTLAGVADPQRGWGRADERWRAMDVVRTLGGPDWFALGDADLGLHLVRTAALRAGQTLTEVTGAIAARLGVHATILPMTDDPVRTRLETESGTLAFQDYFVRERCAPEVRTVSFDGVREATPNPRLIEALAAESVEVIVICPSNPLLSIDPILSLPGLRRLLRASRAPVIAVSPLIGGDAVKGPTVRILRSTGHTATAAGVADHYEDILDAFVLDAADEAEAGSLELPIGIAPILMTTLDDKIGLAGHVLDLARRLGRVVS